MKKIIIALSLVFISISGFSQISGGLFAGPSLSWFGVDSKMQSNDGVQLGYNFGAMADFSISDNFLFNMAVKYNQVGGTMKYDYGAMVYLPDIDELNTVSADKNMKFNLNYLELPFGFKGKTNEIGFMSYFMKAGVAPMIRLKSKVDVSANSDDLFTENTSLFNMNWYMGGGFEWSLSGNTRFLVELVYNGGIFDFVSSNDMDSNLKNSSNLAIEGDPNDDQFAKDEVTIGVFEDENSGNFRDHVGKVNSLSLKVGILF